MKKLVFPLTFMLSVALVACQQPSVPTSESAGAAVDVVQPDAIAPTELTEVDAVDTAADQPTDTAGAQLDAQALNAWPVLKSGSNGQDVKALQYLLRAHGKSVSVDGAFGPGTQSAVKAFQSSRSLAADGVVGPQTWQALLVTVQQGNTGEAVKAVQMYVGATVDGVFGPGTASAVKAFQSAHKLSADGVVGPQTWQALVAGGTGSGTGGGGGTGTSSRARLAQQILSNSRIALNPSSDTRGGSAYQSMKDTANGKMAVRGCHGAANCGQYVYLNESMLTGMLKVAGQYRFYVTSTTGSGAHMNGSLHYSGRAFDIGTINGVTVTSANRYYRAFMQACRAAGADEVLGPGDAGHSTHIHCGWR